MKKSAGGLFEAFNVPAVLPNMYMAASTAAESIQAFPAGLSLRAQCYLPGVHLRKSLLNPLFTQGSAWKGTRRQAEWYT
jgi:hypothetical protein